MTPYSYTRLYLGYLELAGLPWLLSIPVTVSVDHIFVQPMHVSHIFGDHAAACPSNGGERRASFFSLSLGLSFRLLATMQ